MAGLEKIKSQILDEAKESANVKIEDAKAQAEQMKTQAQAEGAAQAEQILKKSEAEVAAQKERVKSAIDLQRRTRLLEAKQEMIAEIIEKAYEKVISLAPDEYYQNAPVYSGSIRTSAGGRDLFLCKRFGKYAGRIWQRN